MINKFSGNTTLKEAIEEMEYNGLTEITRIMPHPQLNAWIFEYN